MHPLPRRLRRLPSSPDDPSVLVAATPLARLLGLAGLRAPDVSPGIGLLLPRTRSIHTFGMRFALDLEWRDSAGAVVRVDLGVRPGRLRYCHRARSVVERASAPPAALGGGSQPGSAHRCE